MIRHRIGLLAAAAGLSLVLAAPAQAQFPDLSKVIGGAKSVQKMGESFRKISEPEEIKVGRDLAGIVLGAAPLTRNPAQQAYVNRVGRWLALHSERPDLPWKFGVVDSSSVNASTGSKPGASRSITTASGAGVTNSARRSSVFATCHSWTMAALGPVSVSRNW